MSAERMDRNTSYAPDVALLPRSEKAYDRTPVHAPRPMKDSVLCCLSTMDRYGRMTPGFCGPDCERRPR